MENVKSGSTVILLAALGDMSLIDTADALSSALVEQFGRDEYACPRFSMVDVFPGYLIARGPDSELYRISYTIDGETITFGEAQEVETAYVPVAQAASFVGAMANANDPDDVYPVCAMTAGWGNGSLNGQAGVPQYYPPEFVAKVAQALNGARFGRRHPAPTAGDPMGTDQPERIAGWFDGGRFVDGKALANLHLLKSEDGLRATLSAAREAGKLSLFGLSVLGYIQYKAGTVEGKKCLIAQNLAKLSSVDLCAEAAAGGSFLNTLRLAASASFGAEIATAQLAAVKQGSSGHTVRPQQSGAGREGAGMKQAIVLLLASLSARDKKRADELQGKFNGMAETGYADFLAEVSVALASANDSASNAVLVTAQAALARAEAIQVSSLIETRLTASRLPVPAQTVVREHLARLSAAGVIPNAETIDSEIESTRTAFAAFSSVGRVSTTGVRVTLDTQDKMALAMDGMFGVKAAAASGVKPFRGPREAYAHITGDESVSMIEQGGFYRTSLAVSTATFPNLLLDSMTKRLLQDYAELGMNGLDQLYYKAPISDYKLQQRVREGYIPELPIVAEAAPYTELTPPTDERTNYAVVKRGGLLTVSEETIKNDDLGALARFPTRLARAGNKTLKKFITNFFVNNPNYVQDGVSIFNAAHNNLGALPLTEANLETAQVSLMSQTEPGSGELLAWSLDWIMVPIALTATARMINRTNSEGNAFYQKFGANDERIIVNEMLTDANDWYYGTLPSKGEFLEMGFLDGIEQPQIFLANQPTVGTQFSNDQLQYKVKQVFGGQIVDFRGIGKQVNA